MPRRVSAASLALEHQPHALYRFFDRSDVLLYVGITVNLSTRIKNHSKGKPWWTQIHSITVEHFDTRREALDAERKAIREEKPLHNDQHNQMVSLPDTPPAQRDGRGDQAEALARQLLRSLNDEEREVVLFDERHDLEGEERSERDQIVAAAESAITTVMWERHLTRELLDDLLSFLPEDAGTRYLMDVRRDLRARWGEDHYVSEQDVLIGAAERHTADIAASYLARLDPAEATEWRACAENIENLVGRQGDRYAARYAAWWKSDTWVPQHACHGPGKHGARCPSKVEARVWYKTCPRCSHERTDCEGHLIWCMPHMKAAATGRMDMFDGIPFTCFPIERFEAISPEELEPPF